MGHPLLLPVRHGPPARRRCSWGRCRHRPRRSQQRNQLRSNRRPQPGASIPTRSRGKRPIIPLSNVSERRSRLRRIDRRLNEPHLRPQLLVRHRDQPRPKGSHRARPANHRVLPVHANLLWTEGRSGCRRGRPQSNALRGPSKLCPPSKYRRVRQTAKWESSALARSMQQRPLAV